MSNLIFREKNKFEELFGMASGYVMTFSDSTFQEFVAESTQKDIFDPLYNKASGSKANRLRAFWERESGDLVGKLLSDLLDHWQDLNPESEERQKHLHQECRLIAERLRDGIPGRDDEPALQASAPQHERALAAQAPTLPEPVLPEVGPTHNENRAARQGMHQFPEMPASDDLLKMLEALKSGVVGWPEDDFDEEYRRIRRVLVRHPSLKNILPDFLQKCRDVGDCRAYSQRKFESQHLWDAHVRESLTPLFSHLEDSALALDGYEIRDRIGEGGFGEVFRIQHKLLGREFAAKVFQPAFYEGGDGLERFFQEASMLFELNHPNIVRVYQVGLIGQRPFFVMDYFRGQNLTKALIAKGAMPPGKALTLTRLICGAVQHAHEMGIVHRDLKPSNILVAPREQCRVIDFGLGIYVEGKLGSRLTRTGNGIGGDQFTAPELLANPKRVSPESDVYSIGAIWYHVLSNRFPIGANVAGALDQVDGLDAAHRDIILGCLSDAGTRYQSCNDVLDAMDAAARRGKK
ncbi:serine/threonine-protein kinase [Sorangium cellulosum]|uniref:serine/threonine-protein kinase n=1 Tax=Sorangium cellulosum TaxID=56 RepID=UPI0009D6B383|nr:serine/threonine-protein kinase [Sorangium cellulosum]